MTLPCLSHAAELLKNPSLKVYEIAAMCGYTSKNYFLRVFKRKYARTPEQYRAILNGKGKG